ncbi:MAG: Ni/Fe hydrogenase subunit alpha [Acidobacteriota bacterium]
MSGSTRRLVIEPVTRVEGHGKVTILLDERQRVREARLHIVEFRGFERFVQGRPFWEVPVLVQRLCGICPVSHHLAASKAMDRIAGVDRLSPTAEKIRRLMHMGQIFQSHALHFFHLASPDLLFGFDADPSVRNVIGVARHHPELARQGVLMRKFGQEVIRATGGKRVHAIVAVPGGVNRSLDPADRERLRAEVPRMMTWAEDAVALARDYTLEHLEQLAEFGSFPSNHLGLVTADGDLELYDGLLRAIGEDGATLFDGVENERYAELLAEEVRPWSYMKFPFIRSLGPERGWYRVGPLARLNVCRRIPTPRAEQARRAFFDALGGAPCHVTMAYHWARMIETLHAIEQIERLLDDPDIVGDDLLREGERRDEAVGVIEAPRGTLFHHYRVDANDQIVMANLIVSTTSNNEPMNRAVRQVAERHLAGRTEIDDGLLNHVEVAIRAYDPCLSCATHALGRMPLEVELRGADGALLDRRTRD